MVVMVADDAVVQDATDGIDENSLVVRQTNVVDHV